MIAPGNKENTPGQQRWFIDAFAQDGAEGEVHDDSVGVGVVKEQVCYRQVQQHVVVVVVVVVVAAAVVVVIDV